MICNDTYWCKLIQTTNIEWIEIESDWLKCIQTTDCKKYGYKNIDSSCFDLAIAKPNPIINTDLLIISCNYLSLICKSEILYPTHCSLYLHIRIYYNPWLQYNKTLQQDCNCQAQVQTLSRSSPDDYKVTSNSQTISSHKVWTKSWLYNCNIPPPTTTIKLFWVNKHWNLFMKWITSMMESSKRLVRIFSDMNKPKWPQFVA